MKKLVRSVGIISAAVAFGAGTALAAPMAVAQSSLPGSSAPDTCGESVVTPSGLAAAGWGTPSDETPAAIAAVTGAPPEVGPAALVFGVQDAAKPGVSMYKNAERMPLSELLSDDGELLMNFDYTADGQAPALQIRLLDASVHESSTLSGKDVGFATIVWSPEAGEGWQTANPAEADNFWVTRILEGPNGDPIPRQTMMPLEEIVELNPDALVTDYGVQKTKENAAESVAIDNFTFGCETDNFELDAPAGGLAGILGTVSGIFQS